MNDAIVISYSIIEIIARVFVFAVILFFILFIAMIAKRTQQPWRERERVVVGNLPTDLGTWNGRQKIDQVWRHRVNDLGQLEYYQKDISAV